MATSDLELTFLSEKSSYTKVDGWTGVITE